MTVTVARYVAAALAERGLTHLFMVTGGGAMFLNDALGHEPALKPVFCHHEQACAMAAEAHARISGRTGVVNVTTGPGGLNALNGVFGAWTDSVALRSYDLPAAVGADFGPELDRILATPGPTVCEVILDETQSFESRMSSRQLEDGRIVTPPLEDMYPFLDRDELASNMLE